MSYEHQNVGGFLAPEAADKAASLLIDMYRLADAGIPFACFESPLTDDKETEEYCARLRELFFPHDNGKNATETIKRAVAFASFVSRRLLFEGVPEEAFYQTPYKLDDVTAVQARAESYLSPRPKLDIIIGNFMHQISAHPDYAEEARLVVGFQFLAIEEYLQTPDAINAQVNNLKGSLEDESIARFISEET